MLAFIIIFAILFLVFFILTIVFCCKNMRIKRQQTKLFQEAMVGEHSTKVDQPAMQAQPGAQPSYTSVAQPMMPAPVSGEKASLLEADVPTGEPTN